MNKFIIDNRTTLNDKEVLKAVLAVVELGRISNDNTQYCYGTEITIKDNNYLVWTSLNKKSERFVIVNA